MKKLICTILAVSIIFISCKKDEEEVKASIVGVWAPKFIDMEMSFKVSMGSMVLQEMDTSYTVSPGDEEFADFADNMEFTADGKAISDGDTSSYTYSGNVLKITDVEEDGTEEVTTFECVVTATSLKMTIEESEESVDDGMSYSNRYKMTLNAERE